MIPDPIAAIATPPGTGAVCLLRVSGEGSLALVESRWRGIGKLSDVPPRVLVRGTITDAHGQPIDDVLAVRFAAPASYTGEETVEIHGHGGILVARLLLDSLFAAGARPAGPGEFTQRAFLNGKLDLAQAEAVMDVISAQTGLALRAAQGQLAGGISAAASSLRETIIGLLAHVEAYIDFPDEDIDPDTGAAMLARIDSAITDCHRLLDTAERGRILRQGLRLVIAGEPNAGKSSLLNRLLGFERAIVSPEAGTTRDTVEETLDLGGVPVRLIDTAGLRDASHGIEELGIERTRAALNNADFLLEVIDATRPPEETSRVEVPGSLAHHRVVLNKSDQPAHPAWDTLPGSIPVSCTTGDGIEALIAALKEEVHLGAGDTGAALVAINARHQHCLREAASALAEARARLAESAPPELTAEELRAALNAIGDITGRADAEEILGAIFGRFCIGK